jgi:hypothetical protein
MVNAWREVSAAMRQSEGGLRLQAVVARKGNNAEALKKCLATANQNGWVETAAFIESIV